VCTSRRARWPAKAKTIKKYLGKDYKVLASYGHVRDLVPKEGAVDPAADFAMKYRIIEKNEKHVDSIAKALKKADALLLATDPDREGEAISWHLHELLKERGELKGKAVHRITPEAIRRAVANPRELDTALVDAQETRRILDRLYGYEVSPVLWKKVKRGLSAGRVQSVADQGAPVEFIYPREGAPVIMVAACVTEGAPQPKLGQQFLQHLVSAEVQGLIAQGVGWGPVNKNTKLAPEVAKRVVYGPQQVAALVAPNYTVINAKRAEWTQRWNRAVEK